LRDDHHLSKVNFSCLKDNGNYYFLLFGYDSNTIKFINLLLLLFNRVVFFHSSIICFEFNPIIEKDKLFELYNNIEYLKIEPLIDLKEISKLQLDSSLIYLNLAKSIRDSDLKTYFNIFDKIYQSQYIEYQYSNNNEDPDNEFEKQIYENLKITSVSIESGNEINSSVKPLEGNYLYNTILKNKFTNLISTLAKFVSTLPH
jgi:hypothetical protein